jgi:hypothetical protein
MTDWKADELDAIAQASELEISALRPDGTLRDPVTIWVVRVGDDLFVRSVRGSAGSWYRGSQQRNEGRVDAGGVTQEVEFLEADHGLDRRHGQQRSASLPADTSYLNFKTGTENS